MTSTPWRWLTGAVAASLLALAPPPTLAADPPTIVEIEDSGALSALNDAFDRLSQGDAAGAEQAIATLEEGPLSPYEQARLALVRAALEEHRENYAGMREQLTRAVESGGLNAQEAEAAQFHIAASLVADGHWAEGAAALEERLRTVSNPNPAAYYLLGVAYYSLGDYDRALPAATQATRLDAEPPEEWLQLVAALHMRRGQHQAAIPWLERLIELRPDEKTYWLQLSSAQQEANEYDAALATMQLAYGNGLLTEQPEIERLADLLVFLGQPNRAAEILREAMAAATIPQSEAMYRKIGEALIRAAELDEAVAPLERAAELATTGDAAVRLAEVHVQRRDWAAAIRAADAGLAKGRLTDAGKAHLMKGVALFSTGKYAEAEPWLADAAKSPEHRAVAMNYLQALQSRG